MFYLAKFENARMGVAEPHYVEAGATIQEGMALVLSGGKLAKCGSTTKPAYIAMTSGVSGQKIPVIPVDGNQLYRVPCTAVPASIGIKVTIHSDGLQVTGTTTDGVATVIDLNGATKAGDDVYVKFI